MKGNAEIVQYLAIIINCIYYNILGKTLENVQCGDEFEFRSYDSLLHASRRYCGEDVSHAVRLYLMGIACHWPAFALVSEIAVRRPRWLLAASLM